jgi:hypothetical protein
MFENLRTCGARTLRRAPRGLPSSAERRHTQFTHSQRVNLALMTRPRVLYALEHHGQAHHIYVKGIRP